MNGSPVDLCRRIICQTHNLYTDLVVPKLEGVSLEQQDKRLRPSGYEVLFGPPIISAGAFFIGFQPGGATELGDYVQPASRDPMWPDECAYATAEWALARRLRVIFGEPFLHNCTGSNRQFFRSEGDKIYIRWPSDLRARTQEFSSWALAEIVHACAPKRIIFIGKRAMFSLASNIKVVQVNAKQHFRLGTGSYCGIPAIGCAHLTGVRLTGNEFADIKSALKGFVDLT